MGASASRASGRARGAAGSAGRAGRGAVYAWPQPPRQACSAAGWGAEVGMWSARQRLARMRAWPAASRPRGQPGCLHRSERHSRPASAARGTPAAAASSPQQQPISTHTHPAAPTCPNCSCTVSTWSTISCGSRLRAKPPLPVAQKVQRMGQPTCGGVRGTATGRSWDTVPAFLRKAWRVQPTYEASAQGSPPGCCTVAAGMPQCSAAKAHPPAWTPPSMAHLRADAHCEPLPVCPIGRNAHLSRDWCERRRSDGLSRQRGRKVGGMPEGCSRRQRARPAAPAGSAAGSTARPAPGRPPLCAWPLPCWRYQPPATPGRYQSHAGPPVPGVPTVSTTRPSASCSRNLRVPSGEATLWCSTDRPVRTPCGVRQGGETRGSGARQPARGGGARLRRPLEDAARDVKARLRARAQHSLKGLRLGCQPGGGARGAQARRARLPTRSASWARRSLDSVVMSCTLRAPCRTTGSFHSKLTPCTAEKQAEQAGPARRRPAAADAACMHASARWRADCMAIAQHPRRPLPAPSRRLPASRHPAAAWHGTLAGPQRP